MGPTAIVVTAPLEICSTSVVSTLIQGIVCEKDTHTQHTHTQKVQVLVEAAIRRMGHAGLARGKKSSQRR